MINDVLCLIVCVHNFNLEGDHSLQLRSKLRGLFGQFESAMIGRISLKKPNSQKSMFGIICPLGSSNSVQITAGDWMSTEVSAARSWTIEWIYGMDRWNILIDGTYGIGNNTERIFFGSLNKSEECTYPMTLSIFHLKIKTFESFVLINLSFNS